MRARISGTGSYLPTRVMTNREVCERTPVTEEWIIEKLGILERRVAAPDEQTSDLGLHAARSALEMAGIGPNDLDGILCAIGTGDVIAPATAGYIQHKLGATNRGFAIDLKLACAGAVGAIMMARGLVESGMAKHVLVVGTYILSRTSINWNDKFTAPIFGDGAGAVIVSRSEDGSEILESRLHTDGSLTEIVGRFVGGTKEPLTPQALEEGTHHLKMDGKAVWACATTVIPEVVREVLSARQMSVADVDFVVSHQANKRMIQHILDELGVPPEKTYFNVERYANTSASSVLIALDEVVRAGRVKKGDLVVLTAIGAGMTWGAHLLRW